jgi:hypothetical protein
MLLHWLARLAPGGVAWFVRRQEPRRRLAAALADRAGLPLRAGRQREGVPVLRATNRVHRRPEGMEAALAAAEARTDALDFEQWVDEKAMHCCGSPMSSPGRQPGRGRRPGRSDDGLCALEPGERADDPEAYVKRMVVNAHISWWRRFRRREAPAPDPVRTRAGRPTVRRHEPSRTPSGAVRDAADKQRAAVVLRFYEELSYAEIGVLLHCAEATARSHAQSFGRTEDHAEQGRSRGCLSTSTTLSRSSAPRSFGVPEQPTPRRAAERRTGAGGAPASAQNGGRTWPCAAAVVVVRPLAECGPGER